MICEILTGVHAHAHIRKGYPDTSWGNTSSVCGGFELLQFSSILRARSQLFSALVETSSDFLKRFSLGLWDPKMREYGEAEQQRSKQDKHIGIQPSLGKKDEKNTKMRRAQEMAQEILLLSIYLYVWEGHGYHKVAGPVAATSEGNGSRPRSLAEEFGHYEPGNGARTDLEETHKEENGRHADIAHPRVISLQGRMW